MALKANLRQFLDEDGKVLELTEQAKMVYKFLSKIVYSVSQNIDQQLLDVDLKCNTRAKQLSCRGTIKAKCITSDVIEWHCDTCEASGTVSSWKNTMWDMQKRTIH